MPHSSLYYLSSTSYHHVKQRCNKKLLASYQQSQKNHLSTRHRKPICKSKLKKIKTTLGQSMDLSYLRSLQKEAFKELHQQMQTYNDAFVLEMRQQERYGPPHASRRLSNQENRDPVTEDLIQMLAAGSVKDYSVLVEYHKVSHDDNEDQGYLGDMW